MDRGEEPTRLNRRELIRRGAAAGALVWAAPAVTRISPAFAQTAGSPACSCKVYIFVKTGPVPCSLPSDCGTAGCSCIECTIAEPGCACACCCQATVRCAECPNATPCSEPISLTNCHPFP